MDNEDLIQWETIGFFVSITYIDNVSNISCSGIATYNFTYLVSVCVHIIMFMAEECNIDYVSVEIFCVV